MRAETERAQELERLKLRAFHQKELARREAAQRELERQRRLSQHATVRQLVRETAVSKRRMERDMYLAEVRERREQVRLEEARAKETVERHRRLKEA